MKKKVEIYFNQYIQIGTEQLSQVEATAGTVDYLPYGIRVQVQRKEKNYAVFIPYNCVLNVIEYAI